VTAVLLPEQLALFDQPPPVRRASSAPTESSALARHALAAMRGAGTIDRILAIARATAPSRPVAGGHDAAISWETGPKGITVTGPVVHTTWSWRALDGAIADVLSPGVCSALGAWAARWRSMHDTRPYRDTLNGHRPYAWSTYLYVMDLARAVERDVQAAAAARLVAA
jgi:hypothetical protein